MEILDGETMANYINSSHLHVFFESLTPKMLTRVHATNYQKEAHEEIKQQAQQEDCNNKCDDSIDDEEPLPSEETADTAQLEEPTEQMSEG